MLVPSGKEGYHLFVIVFGVKMVDGKEQVLLASVCTIYEGIPYDSACILRQGDHSFIRHDSYINYSKLRQESAAHVEKLLEANYFIPHVEDFSGDLLRRVSEGVEESTRTPDYIKDGWL